MFFQLATGYAGGWYGVDPFDQPGVELGKRLTYAAMGRPGFEPQRSSRRGQIDGRDPAPLKSLDASRRSPPYFTSRARPSHEDSHLWPTRPQRAIELFGGAVALMPAA